MRGGPRVSPLRSTRDLNRPQDIRYGPHSGATNTSATCFGGEALTKSSRNRYLITDFQSYREPDSRFRLDRSALGPALPQTGGPVRGKQQKARRIAPPL